jgi:hypothetical protein
MVHIKRIDEMAGNNVGAIRGEYRVYALDERTADAVMRKLNCKNVEGISDDMFIDTAETEGTVWSLAGFVDNWNNNDQMMPSPDFSYIRIFDRNGSQVAVKDDTYRIYVISNDSAFVDEYEYCDEIPNDKFIDTAETEGTVWSLAGFQDKWNNDNQMCPDPEYSWIRIIRKDAKILTTRRGVNEAQENRSNARLWKVGDILVYSITATARTVIFYRVTRTTGSTICAEKLQSTWANSVDGKIIPDLRAKSTGTESWRIKQDGTCGSRYEYIEKWDGKPEVEWGD